MFYTIYLIRSTKNGKEYVGFTRKSANKRLEEHNNGCNKWTRENRPFEMLYSENIESEMLARKREKFFKTGKGRIVLNNVIKANNRHKHLIQA